MSIATEVLGAISEASIELTGASFEVSFETIVDDLPWDEDPNGGPTSVVAVDLGITSDEIEGTSGQANMRTLLVPVQGYVPKIDDPVSIDGKRKTVKSVKKIAPFGDTYLYKVYVSG